MDEALIQSLLSDLKDPEEPVRENATQRLWQLWFEQKGAYSLALILRSQDLLERGDVEEAKEILTELVEEQPDFAEAWNRRAVLYYTQGDYHRAIADCEQVIRLVPYHFGAFHGLGLCHAALGEYMAAIAAFRRALELQPYALINQRLILECTARL